jgi:hypothetical protein
MTWLISEVQDIDIARGLSGPGFVVQEQGRSPSLSIIFEDRKTAAEMRTAMQRIIDKASAIRGRD